MIKDFQSMQEDLSAYFKSNPKEWEMLKWELDCQIQMAMEKATQEIVMEDRRTYLSGIVKGLRIAKDIEGYYKKWNPKKD